MSETSFFVSRKSLAVSETSISVSRTSLAVSETGFVARTRYVEDAQLRIRIIDPGRVSPAPVDCHGDYVASQ
ncbi:MAG: hypothetical protein LBS17_06805 [Actinomycetes bacterium]|nr:hypothetical protein [Actinomycetes bacterium]